MPSKTAKTTKKKPNEKKFKSVPINEVPPRPNIEPQPQQNSEDTSDINRFTEKDLLAMKEFFAPSYHVTLFLEVRLMNSNKELLKLRRFTKILALPFAPFIGVIIMGGGHGSNKQVVSVLYDIGNNNFVCGIEPSIVYTEEEFERETDRFGVSGWIPLP